MADTSKNIIAGIGSSVLSELVILPMDTVKTVIQTHRSETRLNIISATQTIYKNNGIVGFYRSLFPSVGRQVCYTGLRIGLYDTYGKQFGNGGVLFAGAIGVMSNAFALPFDVVKRTIQSSQGVKKSPEKVVASIYREEGWRGFYRGFVQTTQRSVLISSVQLPVYFQLNSWFNKNQNIPKGVSSVAVAGITTVIVTSVVYPVDLFTSLLMTWRGKYSSDKTYSTVSFCIEELKRADSGRILDAKRKISGIRNLYRGYNVALIKAFPQFLLTSYFYQILKK